MKKYDYIIAVDPDCDKSGVCLLNVETREVKVASMNFPKLLDYINEIDCTLTGLTVIIEAGWLNKSHWHVKGKDSERLSAYKGNAVGRNHETGRKLAEMCEHYGIAFELVKPLKKAWNGKDGKITHDELAYFVPNFPNKSNGDARDATLLAWVHAGLPVRVKTRS